MEKTRIAVIGLGWFGEIHCDAIAAIPSFELAALCTRTATRLEELGKKYGVSQLYPGFPRWLIPIADNGSTMGIRRVIGPVLSR